MRRLALWTLLLIAAFAAPAPAADRLDEVRRTFTIDGKPIPPRIFADFGDADSSATAGPSPSTLLAIIRARPEVPLNLDTPSLSDGGRWKGGSRRAELATWRTC